MEIQYVLCGFKDQKGCRTRLREPGLPPNPYSRWATLCAWWGPDEIFTLSDKDLCNTLYVSDKSVTSLLFMPYCFLLWYIIMVCVLKIWDLLFLRGQFATNTTPFYSCTDSVGPLFEACIALWYKNISYDVLLCNSPSLKSGRLTDRRLLDWLNWLTNFLLNYKNQMIAQVNLHNFPLGFFVFVFLNCIPKVVLTQLPNCIKAKVLNFSHVYKSLNSVHQSNECFFALRASVLMINPIKSGHKHITLWFWPQPELFSVHHLPALVPFLNWQFTML